MYRIYGSLATLQTPLISTGKRDAENFRKATMSDSKTLPRPSNVVLFWAWYVFLSRTLLRTTKMYYIGGSRYEPLHYPLMYAAFIGNSKTISSFDPKSQNPKPPKNLTARKALNPTQNPKTRVSVWGFWFGV